jgi:5'-phosphate synthase pdxT subunit
MKIGVLALQGDFAEHIAILKRLNVDAVEVRLPRDLGGLDGLIIPGGESTTIGKMAVHYEMMEPLKEFGRSKAVWGTCAGAIFLSKDVCREQPLLGLMDITVERNAFGRQIDSFQTDLQVAALSENGDENAPFPAVFIRAPLIASVGPGVEILARLSPANGKAHSTNPELAMRIVAARQGRLLATSFHPELTGDPRFHRYFIKLASGLASPEV